MTVARSTLYTEPPTVGDDTAVVEAISRICDEFEHYGWRRVRAALRQQGIVVNHKKVRRLYRDELAAHSFKGSMGRRGNPYDARSRSPSTVCIDWLGLETF